MTERIDRRLPWLFPLLIVVGVFAGCGSAQSTDASSHRGGKSTASSLDSSQSKESTRSEETSSNNSDGALGTAPVKSCAVLSLAEVRKIAPGATGSPGAAGCFYDHVSSAGTEINTFFIEFVPQPGSRVSVSRVQHLCDNLIAKFSSELSAGSNLLERQRPLPGFGEHSLAQALSETDQFEETTRTYSATWLQGNVCVNVGFDSREAHPASFGDFLALAHLVASRL